MNIVLSNSNGQKKSIDELITIAKDNSIKAIEWKIAPKDIRSYVSLEKDGETLDDLRMKLEDSGTELYGICIETDFDAMESSVFAKQCIDMLKSLDGKLLRIIIKPVDKELLTDMTYNGIISFLNSAGRYASYSAGEGVRDETVVRIAYDVLAQESFGFEDIMRINKFLTSRSLGISLKLERFNNPKEYKKILHEINQNEFAIYQIAVNENTNESGLKNFLNEAVKVYDGPLSVDVDKCNKALIKKIKNVLEDYRFDSQVYDYTKMSSPSSVARIIREYGKASLTPQDDVEAGTIGTWHYTFRVGEQGIKEGGGLKFTFHHSTDWQPFQIDNPKASGYVRVVTTGNAKVCKAVFYEDACLIIKITAAEGEFVHGDQIELIIGDTSGGSEGSRAQNFQQKEFSFYAFVDAIGHGHYFPQPNPPKVRIIGGKAKKIKIIAPSIVFTGETFEVGIRVEDCHGNTACRYEAALKVKLDGKYLEGVEIETLNSNKATRKIKGLSLKDKGRYLVEVEDNEGIKAVSNYIECKDNQNNQDEYKIYWGDIHGHISIMDSVGTVAEYYDFARNSAFLDFVCHSEHMDSFSGGRQASNEVQWEMIKEGVRKHHEPERFVTLLGYENSEIWDANVYFRTDDAPWHVDSFASRLFEFAKKHGGIVIPHMTTYPQRLRGYDWVNYDDEVVPAIEIYSTHGSSEHFGGERPLADCESGGYAVEALDRGYKLGFIGSGDGHDCMPGNSIWGRYINGLVAVYTKELTRDAIIDAIHARRCYATTNERIIACFSINGCMMGSDIVLEGDDRVKINVSILATNDIENVYIIKNGRIIYSKQGNGRICEFEYEENVGQKGHNYYYVKMKQKDGEMAWLSPVFVKV